MGKLENKVAIITGASSGIGRGIALAFHAEGAIVLCSDIRETSRNESSKETEITTHDAIVKSGGKAEFFAADVSKAEDVEKLVAKCVELYGRLDIMVNNAGIAFEAGDAKPIWDYPEEYWDKTISINSKGVFLGCKYASIQMMKQDPHPCGDRGWIVNIASMLGLRATRWNTGYVSSKHAAMGITKVAAMDLAPHRVHCNAICPGYLETAMTAPALAIPELRAYIEGRTPYRSLGNPDDVAKAAVFLASEDNTWITGVGLPVDGGYTVT